MVDVAEEEGVDGAVPVASVVGPGCCVPCDYVSVRNVLENDGGHGKTYTRHRRSLDQRSVSAQRGR